MRLDTLVRLRWLAVIGQISAVAVTYFGLKFELPAGLCVAVILLSGIVNIGLRLFCPISLRLGDSAAFALLFYDVVQLSLLLYLTGGLENPFSMLFLAPIMISAASLPPRYTLVLGLLMAGFASLLAFIHRPLPWYPGENIEMPVLYIVGIWLGVVLGAAFIGIYAARVAQEARQLSDALAATELVLAREQHLSQLDGLAAAAAHELGTPLATMTVVIKEMANNLPKTGALSEDIELLRQEALRCRAILAKLSSLGQNDGVMDRITVEHLLEEVVAPQRDFDVKVLINVAGDGPGPMCQRNPGVIYGLGNLVENAIDFARSEVSVTAGWTALDVRVMVADDGPGFAPEMLARVGEPYSSRRNADRRAKSGEGDGLGLGLFIAKSLLERSGAQVKAGNRKGPLTGAQIEIIWPREKFEAIRA